MPVKIRRARPGDEKSIAGFAIRLFEHHVAYDPRRFSMFATQEGAESFYRSRFETDRSAVQPPDRTGAAIVFVAEINGDVVGYVYAEVEDVNYAELLQSAVWVHDLFVEETARGNGAGKALLEAVADAGKQIGADKLVLSVAAKNDSARTFFQERGFRETMVEMTLNIAM